MVEYFTEWAPSPDPLYHDSNQSPQEMTIDPPLLDTPISVSRYTISLEHLVGGRAKKSFRRAAEENGINAVLDYPRPIILRNRRNTTAFMPWIRAVSLIGQPLYSPLVRGKLAVDSVFAAARAEIKTVSQPRPQKSKISGVSEIKDFR